MSTQPKHVGIIIKLSLAWPKFPFCHLFSPYVCVRASKRFLKIETTLTTKCGGGKFDVMVTQFCSASPLFMLRTLDWDIYLSLEYPTNEAQKFEFLFQNLTTSCFPKASVIENQKAVIWDEGRQHRDWTQFSNFGFSTPTNKLLTPPPSNWSLWNQIIKWCRNETWEYGGWGSVSLISLILQMM